MKLELKHDEKIVDISEPLVSPWQVLDDRIGICLVYVPNKAYYWLINNIAEHRKSYELVTLLEPPEELDENDSSSTSLYYSLRLTVVHALNRRFDLNLEINKQETEETTEDVFYEHIGYIADILYNHKENCVEELKNEVGEFKEIINDGIEYIKNEDKKELISDLQINYEKRKNINLSNKKMSDIIETDFKIQKHHKNELLYQIEEKNNSYTSIDFNNVHKQSNELIGERLINKRDIETALSHIVANLKTTIWFNKV